MQRAAEEAVAVMPAPERSLAEFASFRLDPMRRAAEISGEEAKNDYATKLEEKLTARLTPLFQEWHAARGGTGTLVVRPDLEKLRIVSSGARFWAGSFAGSSEIELTLVLTDAETGDVIGQPQVGRSAGGMAGGWSVGASDKALLDYIVEITHHYLRTHHGDVAAEAEAEAAD